MLEIDLLCVVNNFQMTSFRYGEKWCSVSKNPSNRKLAKDKVLELAAVLFADCN